MTRSAITRGFSITLTAIVLMATCQFAEAQNAALEAQQRFQKQHKQTGSIGNGYRPWSAHAYVNSARSHTQVLHSYGQNCKQLAPATAQEHLTEIRRNIAATQAETAKFGADNAKEADVKDHVDTLTKHLAECEKLCDMLHKSAGKDGVETVQLCAHCSGLEQKLKAVEAEHLALLKKLGIETPAPSTKP